jgi:membrane-bound ClpP family serine protease
MAGILHLLLRIHQPAALSESGIQFEDRHFHNNPDGSTLAHRFSVPEEEAIVETTVYPHRSGRVRFQGSWWDARCIQDIAIPPGLTVRVIGIHNITLIVEPIPLSKFA